MNEELKKAILQDLNLKIGSDINNLFSAYDIENELVLRRNRLQSSLNNANRGAILPAVIDKASRSSEVVDRLREKSEQLKKKITLFLDKTEPLRNELNKRYEIINTLEDVLEYLKSYEKIDDLSRQLRQCTDDEQAVIIYGDLTKLCRVYTQGHRAAYVIECTRYWHNVLKDKLTKQYEDVLASLKWPFNAPPDNSSLSAETLTKFNNLTKYLFLIEEPKECRKDSSSSDPEYCLPIKVLLLPLKKRFIFHFTGSRQTARIDRPEWFLTQTLSWIRNHREFILKHVQPISDKLRIKEVDTEEEFNSGIITLASERLHTILGLYNSQDAKVEAMDVDAAFAHAVDETLGFHRELTAITGKEENVILSVLTKAETFIKWLAVEKKYALSKMDETLSSEQWMEAVASGVTAAVGSVIWIPRGSDWFIFLLKTTEDRYTILPQPGHRLQFLELQLELTEEWRVRLTQLLSASIITLTEETFIKADEIPHPVIAVINAAHHTRNVLHQWSNSLHYLQLYYYRRQFQQFTQQHHDTQSSEMPEMKEPVITPSTKTEYIAIQEMDDSLSLIEVETRANKLALNEVSQRNSNLPATIDSMMPVSPLGLDADSFEAGPEGAEGGVFGDAPALLLSLRESGLNALTDHIMLEFKAAIKDYKKQKWHAMALVEEMALSVSPSLCRPLSEFCARMQAACQKLAPCLGAILRTSLCNGVDNCLLEEVVLENWWNTGGTAQFNHDVTRNLIPVFAASRNKMSGVILRKLVEACRLLDLDYDEGRRIRAGVIKRPLYGKDILMNQKIKYLTPEQAVRILNQRTDLNETSPHSSIQDAGGEEF